MINKAALIFFFLSYLLEAGILPSGPSVPSGTLSSRREYSQQFRDYFSHMTNPQKNLPKQYVQEKDTKVKIETSFDGSGGWLVVFIFPEPVSFREEQTEEGGLLIELNQSVDSTDLLKVQEDLGYILKRFNNGYNTLYLIPERDVFYLLESNENIFTLYIYPQDCGVPEFSRSLKVAVGRYFLERRDYCSAFRAISPLLSEYPDDKDVLILAATLEGLLPRWIKSIEILGYLRNLYPTDHDIEDFYFDTITPHSSFFSFEKDMKRTINLAIEHYYWFRAEQLIHRNCNHALYLGEVLGFDSAHISSRVNSIGESVGFRGVRSQGRLYLRNELDSGTNYTANFYVTEGVVYGGGGEISWLWPKLQGSFGLIADWHRPYWELFETIASFGREDRLKFRVNSIHSRWINWNFEGGAHRVGIRDIPDGFYSLLASFDFNWNWLITNPIISLNYNLDAEYVQRSAVRDGVNGPFNPVPLSSREFHTLRLFLIYQWRRYWNFNSFVGETFNRLGTRAVTGGVSLRYVKPCPCGREFEVGLFRYPSATEENANVDYFSASVTWRY